MLAVWFGLVWLGFLAFPRIEPRPLCILSKFSTTEIHPYSFASGFLSRICGFCLPIKENKTFKLRNILENKWPLLFKSVIKNLLEELFQTKGK